MRRFLCGLLVSFLAVGLVGRQARACPMCSEAITATSGAEEEDAYREARAYNNSIYLMAGMPYLMLGGVGFWVYRNIRRQTLAEQQLLENPPPPVQPITEEPRP